MAKPVLLSIILLFICHVTVWLVDNNNRVFSVAKKLPLLLLRLYFGYTFIHIYIYICWVLTFSQNYIII